MAHSDAQQRDQHSERGDLDSEPPAAAQASHVVDKNVGRSHRRVIRIEPGKVSFDPLTHARRRASAHILIETVVYGYCLKHRALRQRMVNSHERIRHERSTTSI